MYKNLIGLSFFIFSLPLFSISTFIYHRSISSSPLQYKQIDYSKKELSFEVEPWFSEMFNPERTMKNIGIHGQSSMMVSQLGFGDINPENILLASSDDDYMSIIKLTPQLFMGGGLLHFYKQYEALFFDIKTALLYCKTLIAIEEAGGGNGMLQDETGQTIYNVHDACTQSDWQYGKFGDARSITMLDNIQVTMGSSTQLQSISSQGCTVYIAGFGIIEIPTGTGTKSEWLFEPQVGTNHWAFGFGIDFMAMINRNFIFILGGNYRYIVGNWEIRSFDLTRNGQWSRYLGIEPIADLSTQPIIPGGQGINLFTQKAFIAGQNQVNGYLRMQKKYDRCFFEVSYNFFYNQQECITQIDSIDRGYGIFNVANGMGDTTASAATIGQADPIADITPVVLTTGDLYTISGAAGQWMSNTFAVRLQTVKKEGLCNYGLGGSIDIASSAQAISTWSVWINFEILLP